MIDWINDPSKYIGMGYYELVENLLIAGIPHTVRERDGIPYKLPLHLPAGTVVLTVTDDVVIAAEKVQ